MPGRLIGETAMYRVKQLLGGSLTLRDYNGQVAEAMVLALNNMTKVGMPESVRIALNTTNNRDTYPISHLYNKAMCEIEIDDNPFS